MTSRKLAPKLRYGISRTARILLTCAFVLFVLGGTVSVLGVAQTEPIKAYSGLVLSVLAVGMYTLIVMFARVRGPPTVLKTGASIEGLKKVKPATFRPARKSQALFVIAFTLFSIGCASAVLGFRFGVPYLWIPGYGSSMAGFLLYTGTSMFGPLIIKPGALVVAFPNDRMPSLRKASIRTSEKTDTIRKHTVWESSSSDSQTSTSSSSVTESESPSSPGVKVKSRTRQTKQLKIVYRAPRQSSSKVPLAKAKKAAVIPTRNKSSKPALRSKFLRLIRSLPSIVDVA